VRAAGARLDGQIEYVTIRPGRFAVALRLQADDVKAFASDLTGRISPLWRLLMPEGGELVDGVFLELRDADGQLVSAGGYAAFVQSGVEWIQPGLIE
jgi:hypothetical protein